MWSMGNPVRNILKYIFKTNIKQKLNKNEIKII
jgi:hypothetical protein